MVQSIVTFLLLTIASPLLLAAGATIEECPTMSAAQQYAGILDLGQLGFFAGGAVAVGAFIWILSLIKIPIETYEVGAYALGIVFTLAANYIPFGIAPVYLAFIGNVTLAVMLVVSAEIHKWTKSETSYLAFLVILFGATALGYSSELLGFMSVSALLVLLGYTMRMYPGLIMLGFNSDDDLVRATTGAFVLVVLFMVRSVLQLDIPYYELFEYGAFLVGGIVLFVGLDILSWSNYNRKVSHFWRQAPFVVMAASTLVITILYSIETLQEVSGTFLGIFLLTKIADIPRDRRNKIALALKVFTISLIIAVMGYILIRYQDFFAPYVLML